MAGTAVPQPVISPFRSRSETMSFGTSAKIKIVFNLYDLPSVSPRIRKSQLCLPIPWFAGDFFAHITDLVHMFIAATPAGRTDQYRNLKSMGGAQNLPQVALIVFSWHCHVAHREIVRPSVSRAGIEYDGSWDTCGRTLFKSSIDLALVEAIAKHANRGHNVAEPQGHIFPA
jgi:hypothetical protein